MSYAYVYRRYNRKHRKKLILKSYVSRKGDRTTFIQNCYNIVNIRNGNVP